MAAHGDDPETSGNPDPRPDPDSQERLVRELQDALRGSERRFEAIVGSLSDPVTIRDRGDQLVYANHAAVVSMGFHSWEEMRAAPLDQVMATYRVYGEDGGPISMDDIPSVRILRGETPDPLLIQSIHRHTGERRWQLLKAAPLVDEHGEIEATIMIIEDVTERRRGELEATFLSRASEVLASSLDYEQTLRNVAELAVPAIVDWCAVDLVGEDGDRRSVAVAHVDPGRLALAERLRAYEPERLDPDRGLGHVIATGEPLLYREITDEMLALGAVDDEHLALLRSIGMCSAMTVPVGLGDRIFGAMTLVSAESGRSLDEFDLRLAQQVAARAAVAIENARLYSERSHVAHTLQQSLAPEDLPRIPGYELATLYAPAIEGAEVGGDFYDAWETEDGWILAIGDVTGKGAKAAAMTALVRHTLRAVSDYELSPARLLAQVDRALKRQRSLSICTALCLRLDGARITMAVGGHPLPLYVDQDGVRAIGTTGPLLGAFTDAGWAEESFDIGLGASLVTYTDGVTDALGVDGSRYGSDRLRATLARAPQLQAAELVTQLNAALDAFQSGAHADDTAVLVVHRSGASAAASAPASSAPAAGATTRRPQTRHR
ncbi:MAG: SpoIIE family protein phosphatase [Solirubrobacteraceae bacterium]